MYETFYGLTGKPFALSPDARFLFLNRRYELALSLLEFGLLNKNGMILLTGDPGTGKTTLIQKILTTLDDKSVIVGTLPFTLNHGPSLLPWVLKAFSLQPDNLPPASLFQIFAEFLAKMVQEHRGVLLVVDEAQNLGVEQLEELRLLFNLNDHRGAVLQLLLAGHTQLRERLQDPQLMAFVQRIGTDFSLQSFNREDTRAYILHRVHAVGGPPSLFSEAACHLVYRFTGGNPRLINQLCDTSLLYGFSEQRESISEALVAEAGKDRLESGILPLIRIDETVWSGETAQAPEPLVSQRQPSLPDVETHSKSPVSPLPDSARRWEEAMKCQEQGWYLEAIRGLKAIAADPAYHRKGWFQVGLCYLALGRRSDALEAFYVALGEFPNSTKESAPIYYAIGQVLEALGKPDEATSFYDLVRSMDPSVFENGNHVGHSLPSQKDNAASPEGCGQPWFVKVFRRWWSKPQTSS